MTREEAIEVLKDIYNYTRFDIYTTNEARTMAIKALEQEPCEDCVSRQAVNDLYDRYHPRLATHVYEFGEELKALPSVTPKREQGEWIQKTCDYGVYFRCSKCKSLAPNYDCDYKEGAITTKYCPNCGAEMR